ncbi:WLM domain-containing protein, partial [Tricharina praecox]|uniref:WLM domain-containing protein n=1 Tax=Tricharina praecox TaxID=43433 RepID=UPI0022212AFE
FIEIFTHPELPNEREAQQLLERVARMVRPVMLSNRLSGESLYEGMDTEFAEISDDGVADDNILMGMHTLNLAGEQQIFLRLRHPANISCFVDEVQICDTLLHELMHNIHRDHEAPFRAMWHRLRLEFLDLMNRGAVHVDGF